MTLICDLDLLYRHLFQTSLARPFVPFQASPEKLLSRFAPWGFVHILPLVLTNFFLKSVSQLTRNALKGIEMQKMILPI